MLHLIDLKQLLEEHMDGNTPDLSWLTGAIAIAGLVVGWFAGVARAAWNLSKFESRLGTVEKEHKTIFEKDVIHRLDLLEDLSNRLDDMPDIMQSLKHSVETLASSVTALNNIIFQERGGLNVLTLTEFAKEREHCQTLFRKDILQMNTTLEKLVENSPGAKQLDQILGAIEKIQKSKE